MTGLTIDDTKLFMNHLLKENTFDLFEMVSLNLKTDITYDIDGMQNSDYFDEDVDTYASWDHFKGKVATLIKGPRAPIYFKLVLALSSNQTENILLKTEASTDLIQGFFLNIVYDQNQAKITTGTNYKTFSMDKTPEQYFDTSMKKFLERHNIPYSF